MAIVFGALGVSSLATAIGFSTGQTYLSIAGFVVATGALLVVVYRKQIAEKTIADSLEGIKNDPQ